MGSWAPGASVLQLHQGARCCDSDISGPRCRQKRIFGQGISLYELLDLVNFKYGKVSNFDHAKFDSVLVAPCSSETPSVKGDGSYFRRILTSELVKSRWCKGVHRGCYFYKSRASEVIVGLSYHVFKFLYAMGISEIKNYQNLGSHVRYTLNYKDVVQHQTWLVRYTDRSEICVTRSWHRSPDATFVSKNVPSIGTFLLRKHTAGPLLIPKILGLGALDQIMILWFSDLKSPVESSHHSQPTPNWSRIMASTERSILDSRCTVLYHIKIFYEFITSCLPKILLIARGSPYIKENHIH